MKRLAIACAIIFTALTAHAAEGDALMALLQGESLTGTVVMRQTASGMVHVTIDAQGVPPGTHAFHIHETGRCEADIGYQSAGGHLAGDKEHGIDSTEGPHPGDFPNVFVSDEGVLHAEFFTRRISLDRFGDESLLDADGSSVILHENADDYGSQPSGDAGDRIACGIVKPQT